MSDKYYKSDCHCQSCKDAVDRCNIPYLKVKCDKVSLNVTPSPCILNNVTYNTLYQTLYKAIIDKKLYLAIDTIVDAPTYDAFLLLIRTSFDPKYRIVPTLPDGTVVLDTSYPIGDQRNTYASFSMEIVGPDHNTRIAILKTQFEEAGVGYETKFSTTVKQQQSYVAIRLGKYLESSGSIRISETISS